MSDEYAAALATHNAAFGMSNQVTNIRRTVFGTFGTLNGREVEFTYSTRMWFYTDGSGYAYGGHS